METYEHNYEDFTQNAQAELDKNLLVKFEIKQRQDFEATKEQGRPIFKDVEYVDICIPGDRINKVCRPATPHDKQRFAPHYNAFKKRLELPLQGTPLSEWPLVHASMVKELAFFNVKTVEHLISMPDSHAQKFPGIQGLKVKAKDWLDKSKGDAVAVKLRSQLEESHAEIEQLKSTLDAVTKRLDSLENGKAKAKR